MQYVDLPAPRSVIVLSSRSIAALPPDLQRLYAHDLVAKSLAENKGLRPYQCPKCHDKPDVTLHAHHDNYTLPLRVRFLCPACHRAFHFGRDAKIIVISETGKRERAHFAPVLSASVAAYILPGDTDLYDNPALYLMSAKFR